MRHLLIKNKKFYKEFFKSELYNLLYKSVLYNQNLPNYVRQFLFFQKNKKKILSISKIRQRCYFTNKSRSVLSYYKLSRMKLRFLISTNKLNAIKKSS